MRRDRLSKPTLGAIALTGLTLICLMAVGSLGGDQAAASLQGRLDRSRAKLDRVERRKGVLTTTLSRYHERIGQLEGQVAALGRREAAVRVKLAARQAELNHALAILGRAQRRLDVARAHLKRSLGVLRRRLVAMYESGSPDMLNLLLSSKGYSEFVTRNEYLREIRQADEGVIDRVRQLRDQVRHTVLVLQGTEERIKRARDAVAAHESALAAARRSAQARRTRLISVRAARRRTLARVEVRADRFSAKVAALQARIAAQINGASAMSWSTGAPGPGSHSLIWPVQGVVTSGFGPRWGSFHPGLDIAVPEGTPIHAAADGTVVLMEPVASSGGYGNYTCVDHGGGLSTCYAHQSSFATSVGAHVRQGQVLGYSGNTGNSTGPHLHFEVRVNGQPVNPLGYL